MNWWEWCELAPAWALHPVWTGWALSMGNSGALHPNPFTFLRRKTFPYTFFSPQWMERVGLYLSICSASFFSTDHKESTSAQFLHELPSNLELGKSTRHQYHFSLTNKPWTPLSRSWRTIRELILLSFFDASFTRYVPCDDELLTSSLTHSSAFGLSSSSAALAPSG